MITSHSPRHFRRLLSITICALYLCAVACLRGDSSYVSDNYGTIFELKNGTRIAFATGLPRPTGIAFDASGSLYVAELTRE